MEDRSSNLPYISPTPNGFPIIAMEPVWSSNGYTSNTFKGLRKCGFNTVIVHIFNYTDYAPLTNLFDKIKDTGCGVILRTWEFDVFMNTAHEVDVATPDKKDAALAKHEAAKVALRNVILYLKDNPNLKGWYLSEEAWESDYINLKKCQDLILDVDSDHMIYQNLNQWSSKSNHKGNEESSDCTLTNTDYDSQINKFQNYFKPGVWSFDCYPLSIKDQKICFKNEGFYRSLEYFASKPEETQRPFWAFCQSTNFISPNVSRPVATLHFLRFEAFSALAYGAQGIIYWAYSVRSNVNGEIFLSALTDMEGFRTQQWFEARQVNQEIQKFSNVFLNANFLSVYHIGSNFYGSNYLNNLNNSVEIPFLSQIICNTADEDSGVLVSYFENTDFQLSLQMQDFKCHYLLIVSHNPLADQDIEVVFKNNYNIYVLSDTEINDSVTPIDEKSSDIAANNILSEDRGKEPLQNPNSLVSHKIHLEAGGYVLYRCFKLS